MAPRTIANSLIFGCSSLAGLYTAIDESVEEVIQHALASGYHMFDTAPHYGCGLSEERLGNALVNIDSDFKAHMKLWTKVGRVILHEVNSNYDVDEGNISGSNSCIFPETPANRFPHFDYSAVGAEQSYKDSVRRLQNAVPIFGLRIHDCEDDKKLSSILNLNDGAFSYLKNLRDAGSLLNIGLGMNSAEYALKILESLPDGYVETVMIAGCWNLLEQSVACARLLEKCRSRNVEVQIAGVFASGLLVGGRTVQYRPANEEEVSLLQRWEALTARYGVPLPAVAMAFCLSHPSVGAIAVGLRSKKEVDESIEWFHIAQSFKFGDLWREAEAEGLIADHVSLSF